MLHLDLNFAVRVGIEVRHKIIILINTHSGGILGKALPWKGLGKGSNLTDTRCYEMLWPRGSLRFPALPNGEIKQRTHSFVNLSNRLRHDYQTVSPGGSTTKCLWTLYKSEFDVFIYHRYDDDDDDDRVPTRPEKLIFQVLEVSLNFAKSGNVMKKYCLWIFKSTWNRWTCE